MVIAGLKQAGGASYRAQVR